MIVMGNRAWSACTNKFIVAAHHRQRARARAHGCIACDRARLVDFIIASTHVKINNNNNNNNYGSGRERSCLFYTLLHF